MTYRVEFRPSALRSFRHLPGSIQARIRPMIDALADDPRPSGCRKLAGHAGRFRVRVGDYRVLYEIRDAVLLVIVVDIGHRREIYR